MTPSPTPAEGEAMLALEREQMLKELQAVLSQHIHSDVFAIKTRAAAEAVAAYLERRAAAQSSGVRKPFGYLIEKAGINNGYYFVSLAEYKHVEERFQHIYIPIFLSPDTPREGEK